MTVSLQTFQAQRSHRVYESEVYGRAVAAAERATWMELRDDQAEWAIPLIVRQIPGTDLSDASTPYGYGGMHIGEGLKGRSLRRLWFEARKSLLDAGIVSIFLRFPPFLPSQVARLAEVPDIDLSEVSKTFLVPLGPAEVMWAAMHKRGRTAVRAAEKNGCRAEIVAVDDSALFSFRSLYEQTMNRVQAAETYFFPDEYYTRLQQLGDRMMVARVLDARGSVIAASLILRDDEHAHYHLSGSTGAVSGANNLMIWTAMQWAASQGIAGMHLGGGLSADDSLHRFKASFGGEELGFYVGKVIQDIAAYKFLVDRRAEELNVAARRLYDSRFFPAYRAGGPS